RLSLEIQVGEGEKFYTGIKETLHLNALVVSVARANERAEQMLLEADFMRDNEVVFHENTQETNHAALWWPMMQVS
ncbi:unnamed protein product, partial [Choristocarpus tenellus]